MNEIISRKRTKWKQMRRTRSHPDHDEMKHYKNISKKQESTPKRSSSKHKNVQDMSTKAITPYLRKNAESKNDYGKNTLLEKIAPVPLSGKPFFTIILLKTNVQPPYRLGIPTTFYAFLPNTVLPVILSYKNRNWRMQYLGNRTIKHFDYGWRNFAVDNKMNVGDGCLFELMDNDKGSIRFHVRVLNGQVPDLFASNERQPESLIMAV